MQAALAFLRTIEDASLAHGVAALLWHTFLAKKIEALATTMDKVKKVGFHSVRRVVVINNGTVSGWSRF